MKKIIKVLFAIYGVILFVAFIAMNFFSPMQLPLWRIGAVAALGLIILSLQKEN